MVNPVNPDNVRGWLGTLLPVLEKANAVTMLLTLIIGSLVVWHLLGQITIERERQQRIGQWLLDEKAAHLALALKCGRHERAE